MKSSRAQQKDRPAQRQKTHSAGISQRPPASEEQQQRQLPLRGQSKKDTAGQQRPGASATGRR